MIVRMVRFGFSKSWLGVAFATLVTVIAFSAFANSVGGAAALGKSTVGGAQAQTKTTSGPIGGPASGNSPAPKTPSKPKSK
jgi:hypothetical protein